MNTVAVVRPINVYTTIADSLPNKQMSIFFKIVFFSDDSAVKKKLYRDYMRVIRE